jgi:hypothetical protein
MVASAKDLVVGKAYFMCGYYVPDLPIPAFETWIYIGANVFTVDMEAAEPIHYFEHPSVYFAKEIAAETSRYREHLESDDDGDDKPIPKLSVKESDLEAFIYDYKEMKD